jgi:hypothetical protein
LPPTQDHAADCVNSDPVHDPDRPRVRGPSRRVRFLHDHILLMRRFSVTASY